MVIIERHDVFEVKYVNVVSREEINAVILRITGGRLARITTSITSKS